jgi:hypothetical protein
MALNTRPDLTYRANVRASRHGWLRLTPAYAVGLGVGFALGGVAMIALYF